MQQEKISKSRLFYMPGHTAYKLSYQQKIFNFSLSDTPSASLVTLKADLHLQVIKIMPNQIDAVMRLDNVDLSLFPENSRLSSMLSDYYSRVVKIQFDTKGRIISTEFAGLEKNFSGYKQLLWQLEMLLQEKKEYSSYQTDALGRYSAEYRREKNRLIRNKKEYVDTVNNSDIIIYDSRAEAILTEGTNWYREFTFKEKLRILQEGKKVLQIHTDISMQYFDDEDTTVVANEAAMAAARQSDTDLFQNVEDEMNDAHFRAAHIDRKVLLDRIEKDPSNPKNYETLARYLKLHPEEITLLYDFILKSNSDVTRNIIALLDDLQLDESQQLLSQVALDSSVVPMDRIRSVIALGGQQRPDSEVVSALEALYAEDDDEVSRDLSNTALLAMGSLSNSTDETAELLRINIEEALRDAKSYEEARVALLAAKNGGVAAYIPGILPYVYHQRRKLRLLSVELLTPYVKEDVVKEAFYKQWLHEKDPEIREILQNLIEDKR